MRDVAPGGTTFLSQTNIEDYELVGHTHRGIIGTQITPLPSKNKSEAVHDPYWSMIQRQKNGKKIINKRKEPEIHPEQFMTDEEWYQSDNYKKMRDFALRANGKK